MADVLDNGKYMLENLPGEVMRKAMETTNKLSQKGSFYYGTGGYETVTIGGNSYQIYQTTAMNPPTGSDGIYYLSINKNGSDQNLAWKAPKDISVQSATNATNATNYTKEGGGTESIEDGIKNLETKILTGRDGENDFVVKNAQNLYGLGTLWTFSNSDVFTGGLVNGKAEACQAERVNKYISNVEISDLLVEELQSPVAYKAQVKSAANADVAYTSKNYETTEGTIKSKFDEIESRLDSLGFKMASLQMLQSTPYKDAVTCEIYQLGKVIYGVFTLRAPSRVYNENKDELRMSVGHLSGIDFSFLTEELTIAHFSRSWPIYIAGATGPQYTSSSVYYFLNRNGDIVVQDNAVPSTARGNSSETSFSFYVCVLDLYNNKKICSGEGMGDGWTNL